MIAWHGKKLRILGILLCIVLACVSLALCACGDEEKGGGNGGTQPPPPSVHSHNWSQQWTYDDDHHWKTCDGCSEKFNYFGHDFTHGNCPCGAPVELLLRYTLLPDGQSYSVSVKNTGFVADMTVPATHEDKPVTEIAENAFRGCDGLRSVQLPTSVTRIGAGAFSYCHALTHVEIPSDVTVIEDETFAVSGLESITIPDNVQSIGDRAFFDCNELSEIVLPSDLQSIGARSFMNCSALPSVRIPNGVTSVGKEAFYSCESLETVELPNTLKVLPEMVFSHAGLKTLTIPDNVQSIDANAFSGCGVLTGVTIGRGVKTVGANAFRACGIASLEIPYGVTEIGNGAFSECENLTSVTVANSVETVSQDAFYKCPIENAKIPAVACVAVRDSKITVTDAADGSGRIARNSALRTVEITGGDVMEGFIDCNALTSVTVAGSVTAIGQFAFRHCDALERIRFEATALPDSWSGWNTGLDGSLQIELGYNNIVTNATYDYTVHDGNAYLTAYKGADTAVTVPSTLDGYPVVSLGNAFAQNTAIVSVALPDGVRVLGGNVFRGCTALTQVPLTETVVKVGDCAFSGCSLLTRMDFPSSVTYIGGNLFAASMEYISVAADNAVYSSKDGILYDKAQTQILYVPLGVRGKVTVPSGVTSIGAWAFQNCASLTEISIPNSVESIGRGAFELCRNLTKVTLPDGLTSIAESMFNDCYNLQDISIPSGVTSIGRWAFGNCARLTEIEIPSGVTSIGEYAFNGCVGLTDIVVPRGVTSLGENAFATCSGNIWCEAESQPEDWHEAWNENCSATVHWGNAWEYVGGVPTLK